MIQSCQQAAGCNASLHVSFNDVYLSSKILGDVTSQINTLGKSFYFNAL